MNPTFRTTMEAAEFDVLITENAQLRAKLDKAREHLELLHGQIAYTDAMDYVELLDIEKILEETKP